MDWLTDNYITNLHKGDFLAFFVFYILGLALLGWLTQRLSDASLRANGPLPLPAHPNPYEIAYLRGGWHEVARLAVINLMHKGNLKQDGQQVLLADTGIDGLTYEERVVLAALGRQGETITMTAVGKKLKAASLQSALEDDRPYAQGGLRKRLEDQLLLRTAADRKRMWATCAFFCLAVLGMAAYKVSIALGQGRHNVMFTIIMGLAGGALLFALTQPTRQTQRGRRYLNDLRATFLSYKQPKNMATLTSNEPDAHPGISLLLPLSIFGVALVAATPYHSFAQGVGFVPMPSSGGDGINGTSSCSSCSSCGSSCGSGCGSGCGG